MGESEDRENHRREDEQLERKKNGVSNRSARPVIEGDRGAAGPDRFSTLTEDAQSEEKT